MNAYELSMVHYACEKISVAEQILRDHDSFRDGIPDAWLSSLMRLKRDFHVPPAAREAFDFLSNEMGRCLEATSRGRLRFLDDVAEEEVRAIEIAYWKINAAIANWLAAAMRELWEAASPGTAGNSGLDASMLNEMRQRAPFMFDDDPFLRAARMATFGQIDLQILNEWRPRSKDVSN
jgi:hypothetical protein